MNAFLLMPRDLQPPNAYERMTSPYYSALIGRPEVPRGLLYSLVFGDLCADLTLDVLSISLRLAFFFSGGSLFFHVDIRNRS
jgi:hypothetical protein